MCICVNCRWVDRCKAYHAVEKQHRVKHLNLNPNFEPKEPVIHINLMNQENKTIEIEWDVQACKSFDMDAGKWTRLRPNEKIPT